MAQHGGKRPGAGRPKGAKSKATAAHKATLEELARSHTSTALDVLVQIATAGESEGARVSAANAILDRGYGKPKQAVTGGDADDAPIRMTVETIHRDADEFASRIARLASARDEGSGAGET